MPLVNTQRETKRTYRKEKRKTWNSGAKGQGRSGGKEEEMERKKGGDERQGGGGGEGCSRVKNKKEYHRPLHK